jgi:hypothetical protein
MKEFKSDLKTQVKDNQEPKTKSPHLVEPDQPMPIKVKPYSHQIIAYNFACRILGIL